MIQAIESFTPEQLAGMREEFAELSVANGAHVSDSLDTFLSECSTTAVQQIARAGIRVLSIAAFMQCWARGVSA